MAQPRAPKIDWLLEAWKLSTVLVNVPSRKLRSREFGVIPLDDDVETSLRELQGKLNAYLNFQTAKQFGVSRAKSLPQFGGANFRNAKDTENLLRKADVVFSDEAHTAVFVHAQIDFILQHCYLDRVEQVLLPATLASVAGKSAALTNAINASHDRDIDRRGAIARIVEQERKRDPFATCAEVLDRICNSRDKDVREVVKGFKEGRLFFIDDEGAETSIGLDRFETIFSEQKPSTG